MEPDAALDRRYASIRRLGQVLTLVSILVVVVSAYLRLEGAGLGCSDWPACYGRLLASEPALPPPATIARLVHRIAASLALSLAGFLVWCCWRPHPLPPARHAALLLLLMLGLAALGFWSADPRWPLIGFLNIMGGLGLVVLSWRVVLASGPAAARHSAARSWRVLRAGTLALLLTVVLGAWIGASYAALSCATVPHCQGVWVPFLKGGAALNPLVQIRSAAPPAEPGGVMLNLLHRYSAVAAVLLLGLAGLRACACATTRTPALITLFLLTVTFFLGGATIVSAFSLPLAVSHGAFAAALLAAVVTLRDADS